MTNEEKEKIVNANIEKAIQSNPRLFHQHWRKTIKRSHSERVRKEMDSLKVPEAPPPSPINKKK